MLYVYVGTNESSGYLHFVHNQRQTLHPLLSRVTTTPPPPPPQDSTIPAIRIVTVGPKTDAFLLHRHQLIPHLPPISSLEM